MKFLFSLALLIAATAAQATNCPNGAPHEAWPECKLPVSSISVPISAEANAAQLQAQRQAQQQTVRSNNQNTSLSSAATESVSTSGSSSSATGNGSGNVLNSGGAIVNTGDGAGSGDVNTLVVHPSMIPPSLVASNPQGNLATSNTTCGPLMVEKRRAATITVQGFWGGTTQEESGYDSYPVLAVDEQNVPIGYKLTTINGKPMAIGSMVMMSVAVLNRSLAVNGAAGLIRAGGGGGQIGGGASTAVQSLGTSTLIVPCFIPVTVEPAPNVGMVTDTGFKMRPPKEPRN